MLRYAERAHSVSKNLLYAQRKKSKMKNVNTLCKSLATVSDDAFAEIIKNKDISIDTLTDNEKLSVLVFAELEKALKTKEYFLTLDCNYAQSKNNVLKVDYFRLVSNDTKNQSMIQFYCRANAKRATCNFLLCTSCAKVNREQFIKLQDDLHFEIKYNERTHRAKTSQRSNIDYSEVVSVVKSVCAVLANSAQSESESDDKSESKK